MPFSFRLLSIEEQDIKIKLIRQNLIAFLGMIDLDSVEILLLGMLKIFATDSFLKYCLASIAFSLLIDAAFTPPNLKLGDT